ncbi:odorant receptor Or2-like [Anoplophora glabripennis]|uniref:odorant receptor Or2-like n=1 Tax=Anoplophora glabripennis TaxID=217634 RepID=UPI000C774E37|nr:odorant receptor Or2-like [Anoplophora glabripennis]
MVFDFLQSSLQLASVVIQLIVTTPTFFNVVFYGEFAICMVIRLLVYYWYANEIMLESINISTTVYECGWYDEPRKVKQMMVMVILRANKALGLDIGPFTTMTLNTFLGIIKTTYSYMMIMYR